MPTQTELFQTHLKQNNMKKTAKEWFNELPDGYRERALANLDKSYSESTYELMDYALIYGIIDWKNTKEGYDFWDDVKRHYRLGSPLPPLPTDTVESVTSGLTFTQSEFDIFKAEFGKRLDAIEQGIATLLARTEPKQIDPNQIDKLHQMD